MGLCAQGHPKVTKKRGSEKQRQLAIVRSCQQPVNTLPLSHQEPEINKKKKWLRSTGFHSQRGPLQTEPCWHLRVVLQITWAWETNQTWRTQAGDGTPRAHPNRHVCRNVEAP